MNKMLVDGDVWSISIIDEMIDMSIFFTVTRERDKKKLLLKDIANMFNKLDDRAKVDYLSQRIRNILAQENIKDKPTVKKENKIDIIIGLLQEISSKLGE